MSTKLSKFCDGVMEAVWLAALIVVPVFFDIYSSRIFEPDKLALLRSFALVSLGAWLLKLIEQGGISWEMHREEGENWLQTLQKIPLLWQVAGLAGIIGIATIFSVTPRVSFWGSYQRLQGTYTTLSYIIIFATLVANLRRRQQVERIILTVILTSLPIGLYGILQRFQIDPVPWGGDVSRRIAANMGNSIFVAAYLILAFPLTLGKIVESFTAILQEENEVGKHVARGTIYVFTIAIQMIALYLSGSRGPFLGWLSGTLVMLLLLSLYWKKRWLTLGMMGVAGVTLVFLVVFSIPNGPFEGLKSRSGLGRLGKVFELDSGTGLVRVLIWQGAVELVSPHEPLEYPDGEKDIFNFLRPLIGYGPEGMYVAYNSVYPPELANIESRNASPDRSHNETWDALVTTGVIGFIAYMGVFISIFYYGLHWLGMVNSPRQRILFLGLVIGGGVASAVGFIAWGGVKFFGVGFPYGMLTGLGIYLALISLYSRYEPPQTEGSKLRTLTLIMFLTAIIAHFGEIHLGIAIAATRTHFWVYTGVLIAVGYLMAQQGVYGDIMADEEENETGEAEAAESLESKRVSKRKKRASRRYASRSSQSAWRRNAILGGLITAIVLSTLGYDYVTNANRVISAIEILWTSLTTLPNKEFQTSYGILSLLITLWLAACVLFTAENKAVNGENWLPALGLTLLISGGLSLIYWFIHANGLAGVVRTAIIYQQQSGGAITLEGITAQATKLEGLLTTYYFYVIGLILLLARFVVAGQPPRTTIRSPISLAALPMMILVVGTLISITNLRIIHADIAYKLADPFARGDDPEQWQYAIELYQRANRYAPSEDFYYLFLGRAYLERGRLLQGQNPIQTEQLLEQARNDLILAQHINPLNTDHTANLARLHRFWASVSTDPTRRNELAETASDYYSRAVVLSPNNAIIWNEWAVLYISLLQNSERALEFLMHSLDIDPDYFGTYGILAQYYAQSAQQASDEALQQAAYEQAVKYYQGGIESIQKKRDSLTKYGYLVELAGLYTNFGEYESAISTYQEALPLANKNQAWRVEDAMARLYFQIGERETALVHANAALLAAPEGQRSIIQDLITLIQQPSP